MIASIVVVVGIAHAVPADVSCTLNRAVKVSVDGKWEVFEAGTVATVGKRSGQWTTLSAGDKSGKASSAVVEAACPQAMALPVDDAPAAAAAALPPAAVEAPVPAAVALPPTVVEPSAPAPAVPLPTSAPKSMLEASNNGSERTLVAILNMKGGAGAEASAQAFTTVLTAEVGSMAGYRAVSRNELQAILTHQADASMLGCDSLNCLADVGKLVDAPYVISGSIEKVADAYVVGITLVDTKGPTVLSRQDAAWRGKPEEMLALARPMADRVLAGPNAANHKGNLEIFATEGATVVVDGKEIGTAPLKDPVRDLGTGVHTVSVMRDGYEPQKTDVVVSRGETTVTRVDLVEIPFTSQPWFWATIGGAALVAGGTAAGLTTWGLLSQQQQARVVLAPKPD